MISSDPMVDPMIDPMVRMFGPVDARVTHVIHIADIHVRIGDHATARVDEYRCVFNAFCDQLGHHAAVNDGTALLVIAGDVFHNKGRMDSVAGKLFFEWINRMLGMLPIVVICGNHDFRQETPDFTDMIELFTTPYVSSNETSSTRFPIHYLQKTGHYVWGNVGFGLTSIKDTLRAYNTAGILDELPTFPAPAVLRAHPGVALTVALFHGSITQSALPSGRAIAPAKGYPLDWFAGYDVVMLGDNHKQQVHDRDRDHDHGAWGYPGSLIQQDFGEPLLGHGYLVWDLATRTATAHHVQNPYGAITVSRDAAELFVHLDAAPGPGRTPLREVTYIPPFARVRVIGTYDDEIIVRDQLSVRGVVPSVIRLAAIHANSGLGSGADAGADANTMPRVPLDVTEGGRLTDLNNPARWAAFMRSHDSSLNVDDLLFTPSTMLITASSEWPPEIVRSVDARNAKLRGLLDAYDLEVQRTRGTNHAVVFKYLEWDYLMCFGKHNWFDFDSLDGKVALLNGPNASGKSSYMDVLCIALFGQPTSSRRDFTGDAMSAKLIYDEKPDRESSSVILRLTVDGVEHEIYRSFTYSSNARSRELVQSRIVAVFEIVGAEKFVVAEGVTTVEHWVRARVGSADEMLMSTMLCQSDTTNFFFRSPTEQHTVLERALRMDTIAAFERVLDEAVRAHKYVLNEVSNYHVGLLNAAPSPSGSLALGADTGAGAGGAGAEGAGTGAGANADIEGVQADLMAALARIESLNGAARGLIVEVGAVEAWMSMSNDDNDIDIDIDINNDIDRAQTEYDRLVALVDDHAVTMLQGQLMERQKRVCAATDLTDLTDLPARIEAAQSALDALPATRMERPVIEYDMAEHDAWKSSQPQHWLDDVRAAERDRDRFQKKRASFQAVVAKLQSSSVPFPSSDRPKERGGIVVKNIDRGVRDLRRLDEALRVPPVFIERPVGNLEALNHWNARWAEWTHLAGDGDLPATVWVARVRDLTARVELQRIDAEIADLMGIEFNPDCSACRKQPKWLRLQTLKQLRGRESERLLDGFDGDDGDLPARLACAQQGLAAREEYERRADNMRAERAAWDAALVSAERDARQAAFVRETQHKRAVLHWRVWDAWREQMRKAQEAEKRADRDYACVDAFVREFAQRESWLRWKQLSDARDALDRLSTCAALAAERAQYDLDMRAAQAQLDQVARKAFLARELDRGRRRKAYRKLGAINAEMALVEAQAGRLRERLIRHQHEADTATRHAAHHRRVAATVADLEGRWDRLKGLQQRFVGDKTASHKGFKAYVYEECVLPLIQHEVNRFIGTIEPFRIKIRTKNTRFIFLLEDRGCSPTLDHASGYQKFVVGLGMRLALSRIQAAGHNVKHLFLDEGFVACDAGNLQKTAGMLEEILEYGGYRSMILMSHLDTIRDAAHVRIGLRRSADDRCSVLQWGQRRRAIPKGKR